MNKLCITGVIVLLGLLVSSCNSRNNDNSRLENQVPVKVISLDKVSVSFPIRTSGSLATKTEMKLSFKTGGIISQIFVEEGQLVQKGQLLARLNLSEVDPMVDQARLALEKAERDLQRAQNLYNDSVGTLEQMQNARTAVDYARSRLKIAEFNRQYSQITAPTKGKILKKLAEENEMIAPGYPLFLFSSSESDWVLRTVLSDVDVVKIQVNDSAWINFDAFPGNTYKAVVSEVAKASDPYTGTYEVELRLIGKNSQFITGLIGKAEIIPSKKNDCIALPIGTLHDANDREGYIYVVSDSSFIKKRVDILEITDSMIYVSTDLLLYEKVIAEGAEYLNPGSTFEIVK